MLTRYKAECKFCGSVVPPGWGYLHRQQGEWYSHCFPCWRARHGSSRLIGPELEYGRGEHRFAVGKPRRHAKGWQIGIFDHHSKDLIMLYDPTKHGVLLQADKLHERLIKCIS